MFRLHADKVNLNVLERETVTTGSVNVYPVRFTFSQDWNGLDKTAVFRVGAESRSIRLGQDGACVIPWEVLTQDAANRALYIGVYGVRDEAVVLPTVWANAGTILCGASPGEEAAPPTPGLYEQIVEQFRDLSEQTLSGAGEILSGAEAAADEAKESASLAEQSASDAESSAQTASDTLTKVQEAASTAAKDAAKQTSTALQGYLSDAQAAEQNARLAEQGAVAAKENAESAAREASGAALSAGTSATAAERLKDETFTAAQAAETAATVAEKAAQNAAESAEAVQLARQDVSTDREAAEKAAEAAKTAQDGAESAKTEAEKAAEKADLDRQAIENLSVEARTLEPSSPATVEKRQEDSHVKLTFGLPQGEKGQSAYQQAVSAGLSATEPEFATALAKVVDAWSNWHYDLTDEEMSDPDIVYERTRPVDWLKLPELDTVQDGEFWLLFQWLPGDVTECSFTMRANSDITVEAGRYKDGVFAPLEVYTKTYHPANANSNVTVPISLDSADFSDLTDKGHVQAVVRVSGELTQITLSSDGAHFVDGIVRASGLTVLSLARSYSTLTYFTIADMSVSATMVAFTNCTRLLAIRGTPVGFNSVADGTGMFSECYSLLALPLDVTFASIVTPCNSIYSSSMFYNCVSLNRLPDSVTFASLEGSEVKYVSNGLFAHCYSMSSLPEKIDFSRIKDGSYMFSDCYSLKSLPLAVSFPSLQNANSMFSNCYSMRTVPNEIPELNTGAAIFSGTYALRALDDLSLPSASNLSAAFQTSKLQRITGLYIPNCSNLSNAFNGCAMLEELTFSPKMTTWETPDNISLSGTRLSHAAILALFESLPTISTPKTVTLTNTPGASQVTAEEAQIATGKGWLLAGIPAVASDVGAEGPEIFTESTKPDEELTEWTLADYIDRKIDEAFAARGF